MYCKSFIASTLVELGRKVSQRGGREQEFHPSPFSFFENNRNHCPRIWESTHRVKEVGHPKQRHIVKILVLIKTFKFYQHLTTCIDLHLMQMKIIIILHVYLFFRQLIETARSIMLTVFFKKAKIVQKKIIFVMSLKMNSQGDWNLRLEKIKRVNSDNS